MAEMIVRGRWYTTVMVGMVVMGWDYLGHDPHAKSAPCFWWDSLREQYRCLPSDEDEERRFEPYLMADDIIPVWQRMMRPHTAHRFCRQMALMTGADSHHFDLSLLTTQIVCEAALLVRGYMTHDQLDRSYQSMRDDS